MFLIKKFKERNQHYYIPNFFSKCNDYKHQNIVNIIKISKSMEPNKCTHENIYENIYLNVFMIFQSLMGLGKSKCDVLSGTI